MKRILKAVAPLLLVLFSGGGLGAQPAPQPDAPPRLNVPVNMWVVPIPRNVLEQAEPGLPSPEELRAQGYVYWDRQTGETVREVSPCRYDVAYRIDNGEMRHRIFEIGCLIRPQITVSVQLVATGTCEYSYVMRNDSSAEQDIWTFGLDLPGEVALISSKAGGGWWGNLHGPSAYWSASVQTPVPPGKEARGFTLVSRHLPGLVTARLRGQPRHHKDDQPLEGGGLSSWLETAAVRVIEAKAFVEVSTVGPTTPPPPDDPIARQEAISRLAEDVERAVASGLIEDITAPEVRNLLAEATAQVSDPSALRDLATRAQTLQGTDSGYRDAIAVTLRVLAGEHVLAPTSDTTFSAAVERFEADGNVFGSVGGTLDLVDEFEDGTLAPNWARLHGTAIEADGVLTLRDPGVAFTNLLPGVTLDMSNVQSVAAVENGGGNCTLTSYWRPTPLAPSTQIYFQIYSYSPVIESAGLTVSNPGGEFYRVTQDQLVLVGGGGQHNEVAVDPAGITGAIVLRLAFDDAADTLTCSFSLDGGETFQSPFSPLHVFTATAEGAMRRPLLGARVLLAPPLVPPVAAGPWPLAFATAAAHELQALQPGITPAAWLAAHAGDHVERFERRPSDRGGGSAGDWCARAWHDIQLDEGAVLREAYFYVPERPPSAALPEDEEATNLIMTRCQLGLVRVAAREADEATGQALALATRAALSRVYGANPATHPLTLIGSGLSLGGSAYLDTLSHWRVGDRHVTSAYRRPSGDEERPEVIAAAALPISGLAGYRPGKARAADAGTADEALIDAAVSAGDLHRPAAEPLVAALRWIRTAIRWVHDPVLRARSAAPRGDGPDLVTVLESWLAAVPDGNARARAAALLVAHVVLSRASSLDVERRTAVGIGPAGRRRLAVYGARFEPPVYDEGPPSYAGNWLRDAWALDDGGPVGDLALPVLVADPCACPGGQECFRWTIHEGERFLTRAHDPPVQARVHLSVARAAAHAVTAAEDGVNPQDIGGAELDTYRATAVAHYRAAFRLGLPDDAVDVEYHWSAAWRLIVGLPTRGVFQCGC